MIGDQELRIRERAHGIWESEGRPDGRATAHWQRAAAEIAAESKPAGRGKPRAAKAADKAVTVKKAAPAPKRSRKIAE